MLAQDTLRPWLDLAEGYGFKPARALQPERKTSDPGKQIQDAKLARWYLADKI